MSARAVLLTTKAAVGGTLVVLPHLASTLGWPLATAVVITVATAAAVSCGVVLEEHQEPGGLGRRRGAPPPAARAVAGVRAVATFGFCFGMTAVYLVVISDVVASLSPRGAVHRAAVAAVATAFLAPLSSPRSIASSSTASAIGMAGVTVFCVVTVALCAVAAARGALHTPAATPRRPPTAAMLADAVSVTLNGVVIQQAICPIVRDCGVTAAGPTVAAVGLALTGALYISVPLACNSLFGSAAIAPNVLLNFEPAALAPLIGGRAAAVVAVVAQTSVALCMAASYPLMHWAARDAMLALVGGARRRSDGEVALLADAHAADGEDATAAAAATFPPTATAAASPVTLATTTTAMALAALALAVTARDLRQAVGLVGGGAGSFIALLLPAATAAGRGRWATAAGLGGLGVVAFAGAFV